MRYVYRYIATARPSYVTRKSKKYHYVGLSYCSVSTSLAKITELSQNSKVNLKALIHRRTDHFSNILVDHGLFAGRYLFIIFNSGLF